VRGSTKYTMAVIMLSALAVSAGCAAKPGASSATPAKPVNVLELMAKDVSGSVRKAADTTGKVTSVAVAMTGSAAGKSITGHGSIAFDGQLRAEITTNTSGLGESTVRMLGSVFYVQLPADQQASLNGKRWLKMDLSQSKDGADLAKQFNDMDPAKQVRTLLDSGSVAAIGQEAVGGVPTVHYAGTVPVAKYLGQVESGSRAQVEKQLSDKGINEIKLDLWVDEKYLPRRVHSVVGDMDMTVEYSDFNKPVSVVAPPASDTVDFQDLMKQLPGKGTGA
jgi:hypothetical protein